MKPLALGGLVAAAVGLSGCVTPDTADHAATGPAAVYATFTPQPIELDGKLDESVWATAQRYPLRLSRDERARGRVLIDDGWAQVAHDDDYLYVAVDYRDGDVVAEGTADQEHHYRLGDLAELFLKPRGANGYWEMYVTPHGLKTAFYFPARGRLGLPSHFEAAEVDLEVAAEINGTLNDWSDSDTGWTGEMRIAKASLSQYGVPFNADEPWSILMARYNYGQHLSKSELSTHPPLSATNFHTYEQYADLMLQPPPAQP
jgi:hypothetical protein